MITLLNNIITKSLEKQDQDLIDLSYEIISSNYFNNWLTNYNLNNNNYSTDFYLLLNQISSLCLIKKDYNNALDFSLKSMLNINYSEEQLEVLNNLQIQCIKNVSERYIDYNTNKINEITNILNTNRKKNIINKKVTVTMTSCKRFDLLYKTISSFLNCCTDLYLIDEWILIDDLSSEEDRSLMKEKFPFITYIFKNKDDKGHVKSMNILKKEVNTEYIFHIEDDWLFFKKENYITKCIELLKEDNSYGQCLLNKNYGEKEDCYNRIKGGILKYSSFNTRYYIHEYFTSEKLKLNPLNYTHCAYWPHYSLRVGMMKKEVWDNIGDYNTNASFFEMEYGNRYIEKYKTIFMDNISCLHIGRCTFERNSGKLNAYDLNNEKQFGGENNNNNNNNNNILKLDLTEEEKQISLYFEEKEEEDKTSHEKKETDKYKIKTYVVNLKRRPDRMKKFIKDNHDKLHLLQYNFFEAIDGQIVEPKPKILKLFESGDYNYRKGIIGCALSDIKICHELVTSPGLDCILKLEDDITLADDFVEKTINILKQFKDKNSWDIIFLGHFLYPQFRDNKYKNNKMPIVEKWNKQMCCEKSMGGTIGYLISRSGSIKLYNHIIKNGMYNAIDWVMFKTADENNIYYSNPHIVFSECVTNDIKPDSDIQYDYNSLCNNDEMRIKLELNYWINILEQDGIKLNIKKEDIKSSYEDIKSSYEDIKESIKDIKINDNSKILIIDKIPNRDTILSYLTFFISNDLKNINDIILSMSTYPIQYYIINLLKIKKHILVIVPNSKIHYKLDILKDVTFNGGYLNVDHPV